MRRASALSVAILFPGAVLLTAASAQPTGDALTEIQRTGRQVFAQSCGVCHLPPAINARTYGPLLSKETAGGNDEVIRGVINEGTPRMPAFKHYLDRPQVDAVIAYLKTVPAQPAAPATQTR
jgi:mono/diheme cytochrome c family protein